MVKDQKIKGCQILFPETVFLKDGKFDVIFYNDKDFHLTQDNKTVLVNMQVRNKLIESIVEKRKDFEMLGFSRKMYKKYQSPTKPQVQLQ